MIQNHREAKMSSKYLFIVMGVLTFLLVSCNGDDNPVDPVNNDTTAPANITDLSVINPAATELTLSWTAPGDDGMIAEADNYDIRYATATITDANWDAATQVSNEPEPTVGGATQTFTVTGLTPNTTYYFAIITADEVPNRSALSNVANGTTHLAGNWTVYNTANSDIPSDTVNDIAIEGFIDRWVATAVGLGYLSGTDWTTYDTSNSAIISDLLTAVAVDDAGVKWIGSNSDGVSRYDVNFDSITVTNSDLSSNSISAIVVDADDNIWFGTGGGGLCMFDGADWTIYRMDNSDLYRNDIRALAFDESGDLWIGFDFGGIDRFDGANFEHFDADGALAVRGVTSIAAEGSTMWFGTEIGAFSYSGSNWTNYAATDSGLVDDLVLAVAVDGGDDIWFGTPVGLSRFNGTSWTTYNTENSSLPDIAIRALKPDQLGNLWIGTEGGLAVFNE